MAARPPASERTQPVHAFKPTSGTVLGTMGVVAAGLVVVLAALTDHTVTGLRAALGAALVALLVWMVLLRPRVTAYSDTLVLRNMAGDVHIPLATVDDVTVRQVLVVQAAGERHTCAGIGRPTRSMLRSAAGRRDASGPETSSGNHAYATFVETAIEELARSARRDAEGDPGPVRRRWAVAELAAAAVLVLALAVSFIL
jgi:hypothetical protein